LIDVAFTPSELRRTDVAVVIDVLRATSTATSALAVGFRMVVCVDSVEQAAAWRAQGRVLAGERNCIRPPGFDLGNSPLELAGCQGEVLVLATTNGAPTIVAAARYARTVVLACLLNLDAVLELLQGLESSPYRDIQVVCSGTGGATALEDVYVAGRICAELSGRRSDAALVAESVSRAYESPLEALAASANAGVLRAAGLGADIAYCSSESTLKIVPRLAATSAGAAIIVDGARAEHHALHAAIVDERDTVSSP
jgi:2-phosphosulfolactate phosphatase